MEAVIYSDSDYNNTADCLELILSLECCNNIWIWIDDQNVFNQFKKEEWETEVTFFHNECVISIGDCLRELYLRDETRGNLIIVGDIDNLPEKYSLHKNGFGKNIGTVMFADGNAGYTIKKGRLDSYGFDVDSKKGQALDIAYCCPIILSIFYDNFDCNTFHDLLLTDTLQHNYGIRMDKRIKYFLNPPEEEEEEDDDFVTELTMMLEIDLDSAKLELNSLRMAYGLLFKDLINALQELDARQELIDCLLS